MKRLAPIAAGLLAASCALTPPLERPAPLIPSAYEVPGVAAGGAVVSRGWGQVFGDPRLAALVGRALARNQDLAASVARVGQARARYRVRRADQFPTIDTTGSISRARSEGFGGTTEASRFGVDLGITGFELDFWGRVRSLTRAALARYLATEEARRAFELSLIADTATTYIAERELIERIGLARQAVDSRREALRIARLRLDAGVTSALDYTQADVLLRTAETQLAALERQRAEASNALLVLTGGPSAEPLPDALPIFAEGVVDDVAPGLPSALLQDRPDIRAAEQTLVAANADIGAARAAFFPRISLTAALGFASSALGNLFTSDGFNYTVGQAAALPIFDFGRTRGNVALSRAVRDEAVANYQSTIERAFREVADGLAGRQYLTQQRIASQGTLAAQRERARLANLRYRNGVASYLEVLDAERDLFDAEQALVNVRGQQLANAALLYVALGGGAQR